MSIIPHTAKITTIGVKGAGDEVNIETDMIGKYVKQILLKGHLKDENTQKSHDIGMDLLAKKGFL